MKIKKLKDLTFEEYKNWKEENCIGKDCARCAFGCVNCSWIPDKYTCGGDTCGGDTCWINNKDSYSDKFLNQEIEIEIEAPNILTDKEKKYLQNVIKPFRNRVEDIAKYDDINGYSYISIGVSYPINAGSIFNIEHVWLPHFKRGTMYKNMKVGKKYTLEELEL